ncbi:CCA tRNA nucleotidyltransferase [Lactobacillus amylovorus]|jgi:tRNA nucleotidyltransferase (CCA-adding enzyme)|uniref:CCA-adding enzyme n=1 Tax=Lactobacillus amylovorus TaxID=1604 RepID=A0AAW6B6Y2_LACAM|nr:CCA tRNA nucleotidyltransferase [Lactobacillus amylovorus]ATO53953.1 CCA tRNA nucleotidyltransferase [Lactobacillus amylovorus DSM 20531]KRK44978.1 trna cca-pyrophosphorylase [Lactobacillus amylovorus DSM 20531]MCH3996459.1 CCA tRNA nucleotidyltransferase [Lactobacillus amylovorus]MCH4138657.1 CCA tRNA nucleotidyltransferase [Lactobacillus amylovorus]MCI1531333.1 CCA tRNA nucleotidyltransferase [Lactobacillus amylovorus]
MIRINNLPEIFVKAMPVLRTLEDAGFEAYFVGGSVRDVLLHRHVHDVDITTSAYPEEVKELFDKSIDTGIKHGTVTVLYGGESYEITTFRTESGYQDFRRPDHVTFVQNLDEDLKRRDFTINALAMDMHGDIVDLFNGIEDLKNHIIRAVGNPEKRFHEDALRMMRAVRFMSQLEFKLEEKTEQAIKDNHELLKKISVERIREEFVKMGLGPFSRQAFQIFLDTQLSEDVPDFAGKKDLLQVYPQLKFSPTMETSLWAVIIILLKVPNENIGKFMRDWKNSNAMTEKVEQIIKMFDLIADHVPTDYELFEAGEDIIINTIDVADILGQPVSSEALVDRYLALPIKTPSELAVDGRFLIKRGMRPGAQLGRTLNQIRKKVVACEIENSEEAIEQYLDDLD